MTNADCIRRMSDEQLYEFLSEWECGDIDYSITFCDLCKQGGNELNLDCDGCRKHWLQRDAVDFGGLMYWKRNTSFTADTPQTEEFFREPTEEEWKAVHDYIDSISIPTGVNIFDIMDTPQTETKTETQNSNLPFEKQTDEEYINNLPWTEKDCPWK